MDYRWINAIRADLTGKPEVSLKLELEDLAAAGAAETLANPVLGTAWLALIQNALIDHPEHWMVWREGGLGLGKEMRRNFSAVLGRFMARAYLERRQGIRDFVAISNPNLLHLGLAIKRHNNLIDLPDWVAADGAAGLVLAEAKGAHTPSDNAPRNWEIGYANPLGRAERQLTNSYVEAPNGDEVPVKRWAVTSRWASENGPQTPFLVAWDPADDREVPPDDKHAMLARLRRVATSSLLGGMGFTDLADDVLRGEITDNLDRGAVGLRDSPASSDEPVFAAALGAFGVVNLADVDLDTLRRLQGRSGVETMVFGLTRSSIKAAIVGESREAPQPDLQAEDNEQFNRLVVDSLRRDGGDLIEQRSAKPVTERIFKRDPARRIYRLDAIAAIESGDLSS